MYETKNQKRLKLNFLLTAGAVILFIYIILFEFILPVNQVLPKPSIVLDSFPALFSDYNFFNSYLHTFSILYSIFLISYFLIKFSFSLLIKTSYILPNVSSIMSLWKYILPIFLIFLFDIWFGNSILGEIIFIMILLLGLLKIEIFQNINKVKDEYIYSALSLGIDQNKIIKEIYWKSFQPQLFNLLLKNHLVLISYILIYELISKSDGLGNLLGLAIKYKDLSITILVIVLIAITLEIAEQIMKKIKAKFFFWENLDE